MTCAPYGGGNCPPQVTTPVVTVPPFAQTTPGSLPFTGGDAVGLSVAGSMLLIAGAALVLRGRKR